MSYWLLFITAFGAATLLPLQSEAVFLALLATDHAPLLLLVMASTGNILGSCVNYGLGQKIEHYQYKRWFPVSHNSLSKAKIYYDKFGFWSLLASWMPIIGDPITLLAGVLGERFWRFLLLVSLSKVGRYLALYLIYRYF